MDAHSRPTLQLLPGGKAGEAPGRDLSGERPLHLVTDGDATELERALADAVAAARQVRLDIERRIERALQDLPRSR